MDSEGLIDVYYGHLEADDIGQARKHGHHDVLVDLLSFPEFIQSSFVLFSENEINKKELLRQAIYKVLPKKERTIETSILSLFSALETLVLIYRRDNDYEFTVPISNKWKKLEKQLKTIIRDLDVFPSGEHREMLIRMLPSLRRVPLKDAYNSLIDENLIYVEDLWTAFGPTDGYSLNDIRNHLSHGDSFDNEAMAALWNAMDNLEVLVKRMILSFFSWNISGTNISKENLERYGWVANQSLDKDMIDIKHHSKVITN